MSGMPRKHPDIYPIIPIHLPYSSLVLEDDSSLSSLSSVSSYVTHFIQALANNVSNNLPEQNNEILTLLQDPNTRIDFRKLKRSSYSYRFIPQKVRESNKTKCPTSLGTACGISEYGIVRIYTFEDEEYAEKWGFSKGDMILDTRVRVISPFYDEKNTVKALKKKPKQSEQPEQEQEDEMAVGFILPVETHYVLEKMSSSLLDFIEISLLPLSVSVSRCVESNRAGGLEECPKWKGIVVSPEILDALTGPSGKIYQTLEEKRGVKLNIEMSPLFPEVVRKSGMVLVSKISW